MIGWQAPCCEASQPIDAEELTASYGARRSTPLVSVLIVSSSVSTIAHISLDGTCRRVFFSKYIDFYTILFFFTKPPPLISINNPVNDTTESPGLVVCEKSDKTVEFSAVNLHLLRVSSHIQTPALGAVADF